MKYSSTLNLKYVTALVLSLCCTYSIYAQFDPPSSVIINEVSYRTETPGDFTEYIELYNTSSSPINIGGWFIDDAINFQFPANTTIQGNGFIIIAQNINDFNAHFNNSGSPVLGPWSGALRNSGEDIVLRDASFDRIDEVDYENWNEWPSTGHLEDVNLSLQLVNINLPGMHAGSWDAAAHTPGAFNGAVYINNPNQRPIIQNVRRSPDSPLSTDDIRVRAEIDQDNLSLITGLQVKLEYKVLSAGSPFQHKGHNLYNTGWTTIEMLDDGANADSTANNGVFTALIPASVHNHRDLVRYRVNISNNSGFNVTYPDQNYDECNYAYYVYDGYPAQDSYDLNALPEIQDFTIFSDINNTRVFIGSDDGEHLLNGQSQHNYFGGKGAVIYDGRVYDHINFRPRGSGSREGRVKPGIRIKMNREHSFETQNDCGQTYDVDRGRIVLSGGWVHDEGGHGLTESLIYKLLELSGSIERHVNYSQLRIVDDSNQNQTSSQKGDFWGLYLIMEDYNGDLLSEHSQFEDGNFWTSNRANGRLREFDYIGHFPDAEMIEPWAEPELSGNQNGQKFMDDELDLDMMYADRIANVIYGQRGNNYIGKHSYREYYNSVTGKYYAWWADMDNSFGAPQGDQEDNWIFTRNQLDPNSHLNNDIFIDASQQIDYQNAMRCVYDLLLNGDHDGSNPTIDPYEQIDFLVDQERSLIHNYGTGDDWMEVDQARWGHVYDATTGASPNTADAHVDWYKQWFRDRASYMEMNNGPHSLNVSHGSETPDHIYDPLIPNTPTITHVGSNAIDELDFTNTAFTDPQGNNTFGAFEWRIAEWSDPNNSFYDTRCTPHYEIESVWESGEIAVDATAFSFDDAVSELEPGRTYKVRMRYKDNTGRWSHWSDAITFIASQAVTSTEDNIVISEIHYNPARSCAEFIEIYNNSNSTINLANYRFSDGIDFTFPIGATIASGDYKIIVDDEDCFIDAFGSNSNILGQYSGSLNNGGEEVKLESPIGTRLDSVRYDDKLPWDTLADNGLHSLALIDLQMDNDMAVNWATQCVSVTPGAPNDFNGCMTLTDLSAIVINEIFYGSEQREFIELKNTGTTSVDIQGLQVGGVELLVSDSYIIQPGGFFILAKDPIVFENHYGIVTDQIVQYPGDLENSESIVLTDLFGNNIDMVTYNNVLPWPIINTDNQSIGLIDSSLDNDTPANWAIQDGPTAALRWTPLAENTFSDNDLPDYSDLVINEIHYVTLPDDRDEFIELHNTGNQTIHLAGLHFTTFTFTFSDTDAIAPGGYFILAEYNNAFINEYGFAPDASWEGIGTGLAHVGELIRLVDFFGNEVDRVNFRSSWHPSSNDGTHSLALRPNQPDNNVASAWSIQCDGLTIAAPNKFDENNDGVCNDADVCANFNDAMIGTTCDDGEACTINDVYTANCDCAGTLTGDADNDGVCDSIDECANFDDALIGTACDDGDDCAPLSVYSNCECAPVDNVALNGTASMSSQLGSFNPTRLIDGDTTNNILNTGIAHTTNDSPTEWMQIDLGSSKFISTIAIYNRVGCCEERINNAFVMVSNTPFPSNTDLNLARANADYEYQLGDNHTSVIGLNFNVTGRYVRLQKSGDNDFGNALNIKEIEVFTPFTILDSDNDGICNELDQCEGGDDSIDLNNNGMPDACEGCTDYITETMNSVASIDRSANVTITSNERVMSNTSIEFSAGQEIHLTVGFEVEENAVFHAFIASCNAANN